VKRVGTILEGEIGHCEPISHPKSPTVRTATFCPPTPPLGSLESNWGFNRVLELTRCSFTDATSMICPHSAHEHSMGQSW
jgi:hypothetical protein